jgi:hypothetical protein
VRRTQNVAVTKPLPGSLNIERLHGESIPIIHEAKYVVFAWLLQCNQQCMPCTLNYVNPPKYEQQ